MAETEMPSSTASAFEQWLKEQIQHLSVDTLLKNTITCTACGEVQGIYVIDYQGQKFRLGMEKTYAFLSFVKESGHSVNI